MVVEKENSSKKIPELTVRRLFLYYRVLAESRSNEVISSEELAEITGFSAAQIRKDLTYFGQFGTPGRGYNIEPLKQKLLKILGIDREWEIALVGVGNLGTALLSYGGLHSQGFNITQVFDSNPAKIGNTCPLRSREGVAMGEPRPHGREASAGLKIKDIQTIKDELKDGCIKMAILTIPAQAAQEVTNVLLESGIKAILNFAPTRVVVPAGIKVLNMDVATELARLSYYLSQPLPIQPEQSEAGITPAFGEARPNGRPDSIGVGVTQEEQSEDEPKE
ncbi:MAG: redox-sensing transcriptional repressor Rex [Planctomycetota bacterium]